MIMLCIDLLFVMEMCVVYDCSVGVVLCLLIWVESCSGRNVFGCGSILDVFG